MYPPAAPTSYPPGPSVPDQKNIDLSGIPTSYDAERAERRKTQGNKSHNGRTSSWDILSGVRKIEQSYEEFDSRNASQAHLIYADGDTPKNKFARLYNFLLNVSIVTRWILFIVPVLGIIWIPGILGITTFPNAKVWSVKLIWWSIWLSVVWGGWWAALATSRVIPTIIRSTLGIVAVGTRRYIDWLQALHRYLALFAWTLAAWVSWTPLIAIHQDNAAGNNSTKAVALIGKLLFSFFLCAAVLLFEKFAIQWIAGKFHERSYAERIADQKFAVRALVTLYRHSSDVPGRTDAIHASAQKGISVNPGRIFKKLKHGVRIAATTTTTALGNVASEIAGSSVLQPNSPPAMVKTALESANKSRLLARRLFYSFSKSDNEYLLVEDIERYFPNKEEADQVFALFDKDGNGDASLDEIEMACLEFHREQLSIENSMRDLDSAVGRLDNIFMTVYFVVAILIIAVALETQLVTLVTGAGTLVLGLSWLIGGSLQEVLTSIIFLFVKHPFDVGDKVILNKESYTVKEIRLLSTIFLDSSSILVQAPNNILNSLFIQNIRRSPQMSETFTFDVGYATTFEDLERLREKMLTFLQSERRDYHPVFDVNIKDIPAQEKMTLSADIKYKSNGQQSAIKAKRRNKWISALKAALLDLKVFGPSGDPNPPPTTSRYTKVPWDLINAQDRETAKSRLHPAADHQQPNEGWDLRDKNNLDSVEDIFDEGDDNESEARLPARPNKES